MKKIVYGAIYLLAAGSLLLSGSLLLAGCRAHTPKPTLPEAHSDAWEEQLHTLALPHSLQPDTVVPKDFSPSQMLPEETAKALLIRQAGAKIDTYFYYMNRWYRDQQAMFIFLKRVLNARQQPDGTFLITCTGKARTGVDEKHLHAVDVPCGVWKVDIGLQVVLPDNPKAELIWVE